MPNSSAYPPRAFRGTLIVPVLAAVLLGAGGPVAAQSAYPTQSQYPAQGQSPAQTSGYPSPAQAPARDAASEAWAQILAKYPESSDPTLNRRVRAVGARLAAAANAGGQSWDYRVFVNDSPNAFVLPGGRVGVNTGLFKIIQNDDQLAAVLGHEIAHNQYNHAAQRSSRTSLAQLGLGLAQQLAGRSRPELARQIGTFGGAGAQLGFLLPFSRNQELEADRLGVDYMARAGFRPSQAVTLWKNFSTARTGGGAPQFMSTHPSDATRIQQLEAYVQSRRYS